MEIKKKGKREVQKWKVLGTTALMGNKAQLLPITRRPEMRSLIEEDEISFSAVEEWFASTALQLGSRFSDSERGQSGCSIPGEMCLRPISYVFTRQI